MMLEMHTAARNSCSPADLQQSSQTYSHHIDTSCTIDVRGIGIGGAE